MPKKVTPGSITQTADAQKDRIGNISNVSRAISQMQKDVDQKISETQKEVKENKSISQVHSSMNSTLSGLNKTIGALTSGVARITTDTAKATSDVVRQYGQAISQDISVNKKSVVAMALAQTSPLYGYFVSKFMETDVWKRALTRMKTSISQTIGAIVRPLKGKGSVRGGAQVPQMQTGGHVKQGGMARLHAGETVIPSAGGMSGVNETLQEMVKLQRRQTIYMRSVFGVWEEMGAGTTKRIFKKMIAPFTIPWKIARKFRKTKGIYRAQLSRSPMPLENIADNVATTFEGLMWRLDNMMELMKANVQANRDLSSHVTGTKYDAIPGVRMRRPAFSLIRSAGKMAIKPLSMGLGGMLRAGIRGSGGLLSMATGDEDYSNMSKRLMGSLTKKRGLYKDEPGFLKSKWSKIRPRSREQLLGQFENLGGTSGGPGIGGMMGMDFTRKIQHTANIYSRTLGGRRGEKRPIWVRIKQQRQEITSSKAKNVRDKQQTKSLKNIRESTEKLKETQMAWFKKVKEWRFMKIIFGALGGVFNLIKMPFKLLGGLAKMLAGPLLGLAGWLGVPKGALTFLSKPMGNVLAMGLRGLMSGPALSVLGPIGAGLGGYAVGTWLNEYIGPWMQDRIDKKAAEGRQAGEESTQATAAAAKKARLEGTERGFQSKVISGASQFGTDKYIQGMQGDVEIGKIRKGQTDFIRRNASRYEYFPTGKIREWRQEWAKGQGGRFHILGSGEDSYDYGVRREEAFLSWIENSKTSLTSKQRRDAVEKHKEKVLATPQGKAATEKALAQEKAVQAIKFDTLTGQDAEILKQKRDMTYQDITTYLRETHADIDPDMAAKVARVSVKHGTKYLHDPELMKQFAEQVYSRYKSSSGWSKFWSRESSQLRDIGAEVDAAFAAEGDAKDSGAKKGISGPTLAANEVRIKATEIKVASMPQLEALKELGDQNKKIADKQNQVNVFNSQSIATSVAQNNQNSSSVGGGGGAGGMSLQSGDEYSNRNTQGRLP